MNKLEEFKNKKHEDILRSMIDYMKACLEEYEEEELRYSQEDIDKCGELLDQFIDDLISSNKEEKLIQESVKNVILKLNKLNQKCEGELIETDQREYLCDFIEAAATCAGLPESDIDITEEWREW